MAANDPSEHSIPSFVDFEIEIDVKDAQTQEYTVSVLRSPSGEAKETMKFPFGDAELESRLKDVQIALLRSSGERRLALSTEAKAVQEFGRLLFNGLMTGEVRNCYLQSQILARNEGKGLRIKLRVNPPKLAALPWEFLYDSRQAEYICLSRNTPLVRYIDVPMPIQPILGTLPLHILGMVANPADQPALKVTAEKKRVQDALAPLVEKGLVEITWLDGGTWQDLYHAMSSGSWHVFHFIGHGGYDRVRDEGTILFEDPSGGTDYMTATQLARLLADHPTMRLVVMNSCEGARGGKEDIFSSTASILVRRGIPAVLAMQYEISDKAAIAFSAHFYKALAEGLPVDAAVSGARISMSLLMGETLEWATPVLCMRSQDGVLFRIAPSVKALPPKKPEEPVQSLAEKKRAEWEKMQRENRVKAEQKPVAQPPKSVETPARQVSTLPRQPEQSRPPKTEPAQSQPTPKPGLLSGSNRFFIFGAGGLAVLFLCSCLVFAVSQAFFPPPGEPLPIATTSVVTTAPTVVDKTITPAPATPTVVDDPPTPTVITSVVTVTPPTWTSSPEPFTSTSTPLPPTLTFTSSPEPPTPTWTLLPPTRTFTPTPIPPVFFIVNVRSGRCVDVEGRPGLFDKNRIQLFDCESSTDPDTDQIWEFVNGGFLRNARSGKCLDVDGDPGVDDQDRIELFTCEFTKPNTDQRWEFVSGGFLKNVYSGKCLDVEGYPGVKNQSPLQLFNCEELTDPNTDQRWMLALTQTFPSLGSNYSLKSYNIPNSYVRHKDSLGELTGIFTLQDSQDATFTIVPGLANSNCISFRSFNFPDYYLRHFNGRIMGGLPDGSQLFKDDATFCQRPGLANPALVSFESYNYPGYYLRHQNAHLYIDNGQNNAASFKADATFEWVTLVLP